jgi:hypothetical protein
MLMLWMVRNWLGLWPREVREARAAADAVIAEYREATVAEWRFEKTRNPVFREQAQDAWDQAAVVGSSWWHRRGVNPFGGV